MQRTKTYEYGCVMINVAFPLSGIQSYIQRNDVYNNNTNDYGLPTTPHITLLYGLHKDVPLSKVVTIIDKYTFGNINIGSATIFDNKDYDVLKFNIESENLSSCNKDLKKLPHTSTFSDYIPHLTIGYLKKGTGAKYTALFKNFKNSVSPSYVTYSTVENDTFKIPIKINLQ